MPSAADLDELWRAHGEEWRDPAMALSPAFGSHVDPRLLRAKAAGEWWQTLDRLGVTLLVTREYEHLLVSLATVEGRPRVSHLALPHPSGLAVDRERSVVVVASTRNPNQIYELRPVRRTLARGDTHAAPAIDGQPLLPVSSTIHPGALYIHDLAYIGGQLHANSVGQNAIVRVSRDGTVKRVWWPRAIERDGAPDFTRNWIQLNSIAAGTDVRSSFYTASSEAISARRPGHRNFPVDRRGVLFSGETREPIVRGLTRPHSARLHRERVWVDNSGYGEFGPTSARSFEPLYKLPGWTRGLCFCGDVAFVGTSRVIPRFRQYAPGLDVERSTCGVHAIDVDSGRLLGSLTWPYGNQIFAIDWIARSQTAGLPVASGDRGTSRRVTSLFYSFDTQGDTPDEQ